MSEQEKIDIIRAIRDELQIFKDWAEVKYATKDALQQAKDNRDNYCMVREEKLDKKFRPLYLMLGFTVLFLVATNGIEFLDFIKGIL